MITKTHRRYKCMICCCLQEYDIYLFQELWMRPNHDTIAKYLPKGYYMTAVRFRFNMKEKKFKNNLME